MTSQRQNEIETLQAQLQGLISSTADDATARKALFEVTMGAAAQLESPLDVCWRTIMSPHAPSAIMTLSQMGVIEALANASGPVSASMLADTTGTDELLIVRLLRPLTALGIVKEVDEQLYAKTPTVEVLNDPVIKGGYTFMFTAATHSLSQMPFYLQQTGFKNVERAPGPFQHAKQTSDDMFPWLIQQPQLMSHFNKFMSGQQAQRGDWFTRLPVQQMILDGADPHAALLVDIGGGEGHDVQAFHRAFPDAPGRLVLQDLPPVIGNIKELDAAIERQVYDFFLPLYDFFTEQPVKGARIYYLRSILHDWSNDKCLEILGRIREAMKPGYSKLLLNEFVLPAKDAPLYPALLDINMMALLNGMERTEKQWTKLLDEAGFKIIQIHVEPSGNTEGVIEAELK